MIDESGAARETSARIRPGGPRTAALRLIETARAHGLKVMLGVTPAA